MQEIFFPFIGGLGLFLIGMMLLSDGLVAFAGAALQRALVRFTGTPYKAFVSGALVTALVQSSTATTVTLIGFVSAGLIGFSQAIGVVIGASLGNTATGWIVTGLGLKINLGFYTLPLIGVGALLKLMARGRWKGLGLALAGFGMLFLGLNMLQEGMRGLSGWFDFAKLPVTGFQGRVLIMLFGLALTAVLQSSTAAIATTLTALHTETVNFDQAASMVVGAAIGTTLTGALVTIGGTIYAKRTALAHILFNLLAGLVAIVLLPAFIELIDWLSQHAKLARGATSLAAFHSLFILLGVLLVLPFTANFARWVERILPEKTPNLAHHLDDSMLSIPAVALEASQRALEEIMVQLLDCYTQLLSSAKRSTPMDLVPLKKALGDSFDFISRIQVASDDRLTQQRIAQLHAADHLLRLCGRLDEFVRAPIDFSAPQYSQALVSSHALLAQARANTDAKCLDQGCLQQLQDNAESLMRQSEERRVALLQDANSANDGGYSAAQILRTTDSFRWLARTGHHIWRGCYYLAQGRDGWIALLPEDSSPSRAIAVD